GGVLAASPDVVATALHCIDRGAALRVRTSGGAGLRARLEATDPAADQAILLLERPAAAHPLPLLPPPPLPRPPPHSHRPPRPPRPGRVGAPAARRAPPQHPRRTRRLGLTPGRWRRTHCRARARRRTLPDRDAGDAPRAADRSGTRPRDVVVRPGQHGVLA